MKPLRQKMLDDMKLRRFAPNTQEAYVSAVAGLARYYNQSPDLLDKEKIQAYLLHLMDERQLSWGTCNVVVSGLRFFYTQTLGMDSMHLGIPPMKSQAKLPEVLSVEEITRLFQCTRNLKHRAILMTRFSAERIYNSAKERAGITKEGCIHTLRHCFASHLLEAGVDLWTIQLLMGHSSITTTTRYMRITGKKLAATKSPLDLIEIPDTRRLTKV